MAVVAGLAGEAAALEAQEAQAVFVAVPEARVAPVVPTAVREDRARAVPVVVPTRGRNNLNRSF